MLQQINLYKLLPTKSRFQLTPMLASVIYGVVIAVLVLIFGVELRQKYKVTEKFDLLTQQVNLVQQQLASLENEYPFSDAVTLNKALEELETQLTMKLKMLNSLTQHNNFSAYLTGLASMDMPGIWLTEIKFDNMLQKIDLKGFALQSVLVEQATLKLDAQSAFAGLKFEVQNVTEDPAPPSFEISAKPEVPL